jgi:hypothetical protein
VTRKVKATPRLTRALELHRRLGGSERMVHACGRFHKSTLRGIFAEQLHSRRCAIATTDIAVLRSFGCDDKVLNNFEGHVYFDSAGLRASRCGSSHAAFV